MTITEIVKNAHENAVNKGFYECPDCSGKGHVFIEGVECICGSCVGSGKDANKNVGELLMLVVSELGEALEAHRKGSHANIESFVFHVSDKEDKRYDDAFLIHIKDTFEDELADTVIRIADMCGYLGIDLAKHIELKMRYNATRERKHGKRY